MFTLGSGAKADQFSDTVRDIYLGRSYKQGFNVKFSIEDMNEVTLNAPMAPGNIDMEKGARYMW